MCSFFVQAAGIRTKIKHIKIISNDIIFATTIQGTSGHFGVDLQSVLNLATVSMQSIVPPL